MNQKFSMRTNFLRQKQVHVCFERLGQNDQFGVRDAAKLCFNFRERGSAQIPSEKRAAGGKHFLRQLLLVTQFPNLRADNVLRFGHAPKMELDTKMSRRLNCTDFGAT